MKTSRSRRLGAIAHVQTLVLFGILLSAASALTATGKDLPTAQDILDRHVEATGGKEVHLGHETRKMTGKLAVDQSGHSFEAKIERHAKAPSNSHLLLQGDQFFQVRASNAQHAWEWRPSDPHGSRDSSSEDGNTRRLEGMEKARAIEQAQFHADVEWRSHFKNVKTVGVEEVRGREAYEVEMTTMSGEQYSRFYDKGNGRLVKSVRAIESGQMGKLDMETFLEEYREFDGVWLPTTVRQLLSSSSFGTGTQTWTYESVEHDVSIPTSLFQLPEDLR